MNNRTFRNNRRVSAILAVGLLGLCSAAWGRDYYVDGHAGNDANEGSEQHPFRTLAPLLVRITACDSAYVKIEGAANGNGVGRYSHAELPTSPSCAVSPAKG